jgi:hypothetical protein
VTRRRMRWEKEKEAEEKAIKAGKPRPILRAALRESKKHKAEREAYETRQKEIAETAARNQAAWAAQKAKFPSDDPDTKPDT